MIEWAGCTFSGPGGLFVVGMLAGMAVTVLGQGAALVWLRARERSAKREASS